MARRQYDDDDGRVIADMSGVTRPSLFSARRMTVGNSSVPIDREEEPMFHQEEKDLLTKEERRFYILGAMKAALLIGGVFIAGLGLVILAMVLLW